MDIDDYDFAIMQGVKPLADHKYTIDIENKIFSSAEHYLTLLFSDSDGWTFNTGSTCIFYTNDNCTFTTLNNCTFETGNNCTFKTGYRGTFRTSRKCTFDTAMDCIFTTAKDCTFKTGGRCTFDTGSYCTFDTDKRCMFLLYNINTCKFKKWDDISIILDYKDDKRYVLNEELIQILKVSN